MELVVGFGKGLGQNVHKFGQGGSVSPVFFGLLCLNDYWQFMHF